MTTGMDLGGPRLVAVCPSDLDLAAESFLSKLAELHARGPRLRPGSVIEFGWAPIKVEAVASDAWTLCEPDYSGDLRQFVRGVGTTLRVMDDQSRLMRLVDAVPTVTRFDDSVWVSARAWGSGSVTLDRSGQPERGYAGWYAWAAEEDGGPHGGEPVAAGRLALLRPLWMQVLALPYRYAATFENDALVAIHDAGNREIAIR